MTAEPGYETLARSRGGRRRRERHSAGHNSSRGPRGLTRNGDGSRRHVCGLTTNHTHPSTYLCLPRAASFRSCPRARRAFIATCTRVANNRTRGEGEGAPAGPRGTAKSRPPPPPASLRSRLIGERIARRPCPIGKSTTCVPRSRVLRYLTLYLCDCGARNRRDDSWTRMRRGRRVTARMQMPVRFRGLARRGGG